ncbi:YdcH family protein [Candidatus Kaiserbacteria bacterium]|nr:YdcH family protein [Candidatus Kaiserbacteria bacterium]
MKTTTNEYLVRRCQKEHAKLDEEIRRLMEIAAFDSLQVAALKRQKLQLKERISRLKNKSDDDHEPSGSVCNESVYD